MGTEINAREWALTGPQRIARLKEVLANISPESRTPCMTMVFSPNDVEAVLTRLDRCERALKFYGDKATYEEAYFFVSGFVPRVMADGGKQAREALADD